VEAALAEPRCFPLKKKNRTASPHPKTALLGSFGKTKNGLLQKQVIYLSNQAYCCLIAVGDTPGQQVGSIAFGLPADPNTSTGNKMLGDAMW
jgi:hypothetical protein